VMCALPDGAVDIRAVMRLLADRGYGGPVIVEQDPGRDVPDTPDALGTPKAPGTREALGKLDAPDTPEALARRNLDFLMQSLT